MGITLEIYKKKIKRIIREILDQNPELTEIFDSLPFKTDFKFNDEEFNTFKILFGTSLLEYPEFKPAN